MPSTRRSRENLEESRGPFLETETKRRRLNFPSDGQQQDADENNAQEVPDAPFDLGKTDCPPEIEKQTKEIEDLITGLTNPELSREKPEETVAVLFGADDSSKLAAVRWVVHQNDPPLPLHSIDCAKLLHMGKDHGPEQLKNLFLTAMQSASIVEVQNVDIVFPIPVKDVYQFVRKRLFTELNLQIGRLTEDHNIRILLCCKSTENKSQLKQRIRRFINFEQPSKELCLQMFNYYTRDVSIAHMTITEREKLFKELKNHFKPVTPDAVKLVCQQVVLMAESSGGSIDLNNVLQCIRIVQEAKRRDLERERERVKEQRAYARNPERRRMKESHKYSLKVSPKKRQRRQRYAQQSTPEKEKRRQSYAQHPSAEKKKRRLRYAENSTSEKERVQQHYKERPTPKKQREQKRYKERPTPKKQREQKRYKEHPSPKKRREQQRYKENSTPKKWKQSFLYHSNPGLKKLHQRNKYRLNPEYKKRKVRELRQRNIDYRRNKDRIDAIKRRNETHRITLQELNECSKFAQAKARIDSKGAFMSAKAREKLKETEWFKYLTRRFYRQFVKSWDRKPTRDESRQIMANIRVQVKQALDIKQAVRNKMSNILDYISRKFVQQGEEAIASAEPAQIEALLRGIYGEGQYHVKTTESAYEDKAKQKYVGSKEFWKEEKEEDKERKEQDGVPQEAARAEAGGAAAETEPADMPVPDLPGTPPHPHPSPPHSPLSSEQPNGDGEQKEPTMFRHCDENCTIPEKWATRIHASLMTLTKENLGLLETLCRIIRFERCRGCRIGDYPNCDYDRDHSQNPVKCRDNIKYLRAVCPHYRRLRTLTRRVYEMRECAMWIMRVDELFMRGHFSRLVELLGTKPKLPEKEEKKMTHPDRPAMPSESELHAIFGKFIDAFNDGKKRRYNQHCQCCNMWFKSGGSHRQVEMLNATDKTVKPLLKRDDSKLNQLLEIAKLKMPISVCTAYCKKALLADMIPQFGPLNNLDLDEVPQEIKSLNNTERLLCQAAKSFQTIIKLKPLHGPSNRSKLPCMRGVAINLPLPIQEDLDVVEQSLPSKQYLDIVVDAAPTKKDIVWRQMVDLKKLTAALKKLKQLKNPIYEKIKIVDWNENPLQEDEIPVTLSECEVTAEEPPDGDEGVWVDDGEDGLRPEPDPMIKHLGTGEVTYDQCSVMPVDPEFLKKTEIEQYEHYNLKRVTGQPISEKDPDLEAKTFFNHFPKGRGHYQDRHIVPLKQFRMYVKNRLLNHDSRFRKDDLYLFFLAHCSQMRQVDQGIYATLKTGRGYGLNAKELFDKLQAKDKLLESHLSNMMTCVRGSPAYWQQKRGDLNAMDEKWGPATFFLTLSCAEYTWEDFRDFLNAMDPDPTNYTRDLGELCQKNPVAFSLYFQQRWETFLKDVLKADSEGEESPLGVVEHYVWRMEYQARGAPHIHSKLWIKDAPIVGKATNEEASIFGLFVVLEFVKRHITCAMPDATENPTLHNLVQKFQVHKCGKSCLRTKKEKGHFYTKCRFGFPRDPEGPGTVNSMEKSVRSRQGSGRSVKLVTIPRTEAEENINDYNAPILLMWGANMDIQYVGEESQVLNRYITGYISKVEHSATAELWDSISSNPDKSIGSKVRSLAMQLLKSSELGIWQVADLILGHPLYGASEAVKWLGARLPETRNRRFKKIDELEEIKKQDPESHDLFAQNLIEDYYPNRPKELENVCLYDIAAAYEYSTDKPNKPQCKYYKLNNNLGYFHKRKKSCVVKMPRFKPEGDQEDEYFYQLLMILKPWRMEKELLSDKKKKVRDIFQDFCSSLTGEEKEKMTEFTEARKRYEAAQKMAEKLKSDEDPKQDEPMDDQDIEQPLQDYDAAAKEMAKEFANEKVILEDLEASIAKLNSDQKAQFDIIWAEIHHQMQHEQNKCACQNAPKQMCHFVTGVGGVGKSFLINTLVDKVAYECQQLEKPGEEGEKACYAAVLAPTGVAAFQVNGHTLHRYFKLPVTRGKQPEPDYRPLSRDDWGVVRHFLANVKICIVDEISMVSNFTLSMVHKRLDELFGGVSEKVEIGGRKIFAPFGGRNLAMFGDLFQLNPPKSRMPFQPLTATQAKQLGGIATGYNLWKSNVSFGQLKQNMRQKDDPFGYAELLNRVRLGNCTEADIKLLKTRVIQQMSKDPANRLKESAKFFHDNLMDKNACCVMPTNKEADEFNDEMIKLEKIILVEIDSEDDPPQPKKSKKKPAREERPQDTGGLYRVLKIGVNAKVMLRRNLDTENGLVNGAIGKVKAINKRQGTNYVLSVDVLFEGKTEPTRIERVTAEYELVSSIFVKRKQFPIHICYAMSIHKCQGISLDAVMANLGLKLFTAGQAYVALSRCRTLEGVHLIDFAPSKLICSEEAVSEYNRLFKENGLESDIIKEFNSNRRFSKRAGAPTVTVNIDSSTIGEEEDGPPAPKKPKVSAPKKQNKKATQNTQLALIPCIRFRNRGENVCFSNSLMQALISLRPLANAFGNHGSRLCRELCRLANLDRQCQTQGGGLQQIAPQTALMVREVASDHESDFTNLQQHDANELYVKLLTKLPQELQQLVRFEAQTKYVCTHCNHTSDVQLEMQTQMQLYRLPSGTIEFKELFDPTTMLKVCDNNNCPGKRAANGGDTAHHEIVKYIFPDSCQCLVILLPLFDKNNTPMTGKIQKFYTSNQRIGGVTFEAVAAIRHTGTSTTSGHYTCLRKISDKWFETSDDGPVTSSARFCVNLKGVSLLFLVRK